MPFSFSVPVPYSLSDRRDRAYSATTVSKLRRSYAVAGQCVHLGRIGNGEPEPGT
jgi:hypothetical protein